LLAQSHRYGYQKEPDFGPLRIPEMAARIDKLSEQKNNHMALLHALDGAISERGRIANNVDDVSPDERVDDLQKQRGETMAMLGTLDGAAQEAAYWRDLFTLRSRGASVNPMVE
jgi:transcription initiation factor TFIID subunit TAF12